MLAATTFYTDLAGSEEEMLGTFPGLVRVVAGPPRLGALVAGGMHGSAVAVAAAIAGAGWQVAAAAEAAKAVVAAGWLARGALVAGGMHGSWLVKAGRAIRSCGT